MSNKGLIDNYVDDQDAAEYEELKKQTPKEMDDRCILGLHSIPENICYAAVRRLQAIKTAGRPLTEEEVSVLPGCPWAIQHQRSNYCFFKYLKEYIKENPPSEQEMAHMLHCSIEDVRKAERSAMSRFKTSEFIDSLKNNFDSCEIVESKEVDATFTILK